MFYVTYLLQFLFGKLDKPIFFFWSTYLISIVTAYTYFFNYLFR